MELTAIPHQCKIRMNLPSKTYSKVTMIGSKASDYLSSQFFSGEVAIAGPRAVYIITNEGDILAGCSANQQPHPRSFLTNYDLSSIQVGQRVSVKGNNVCFSDGTRLDLSGSKVWNRQAPDAENAVSRQSYPLSSTTCSVLQPTCTKVRIWVWVCRYFSLKTPLTSNCRLMEYHH
ncbi:MAG: hypothetical protein CM1200mP22_04590 [Dehalococcoidia bacterium]|nr:MAG: hypothetical protein CM1200mP22_04590 [Dehalococcoidia bacterium]